MLFLGPFQCTLCDRRFLSKARCNLHIRTHSGEKPYSEIEKRRGKRIRRKKPKPNPAPQTDGTQDISFSLHRVIEPYNAIMAHPKVEPHDVEMGI